MKYTIKTKNDVLFEKDYKTEEELEGDENNDFDDYSVVGLACLFKKGLPMDADLHNALTFNNTKQVILEVKAPKK